MQNIDNFIEFDQTTAIYDWFSFKGVGLKQQVTKYSVATLPAIAEYAPDLVSKMVYGKPDLWWVITQYNDIYQLSDFVSGIKIKIPDQEQLYVFLDNAMKSSSSDNAIQEVEI